MGAGSGKAALHVLLLAGGSGTRFWPLSRKERPKQMLALAGAKPLLMQAWLRARKLAPAARIWVATPARLVNDVRRLLPALPAENMVVEPTARDTGPAVGLACAAVASRNPGAIAAIFPTDHVIEDDAEFIRSVRAAAAAAGRGALVCLGIKPDRPATGFGYLKCVTKPVRGRSVGVARFVEKPSLSTARKFLKSGSYLWNAGMFIWKVDRFMEELDRTAPAIGRAVRATLAGNRRAWTRASRLSVDYAVMEKARDVRVVPLDAGWDDIGSWDAVARLRGEVDRARARRIMVNSPGSAVFGDERMVALVDAPDMVVVDTPDALLVVSRKSSEKVRTVVEQLKRRGRKDLL